MTISSTNSRWEYTGDNSTVAFTYDNKIFATSEMEVYVDNVLQTITTEYTIAGISPVVGGTVTFITAPALDASVVLIRVVPNTQPTDYPTGGSLPANVIEEDMDRRTIIDQQIEERISRTMEAPSGEALVDMTLPITSLRASKYFGFDASGEPTSFAAPAGTTAVSTYGATVLLEDTAGDWLTIQGITAYSQTLLDDTTAAAWRSTLGLGTAAIVDTGVADGNAIVADATGLPVIDGSQITDVAYGNITGTPTIPSALSDISTLETKTATTSGTSHDYTGIPATARRITVMLDGVSTAGGSDLLIQIGDAGGIETSGYDSASSTASSTSGFVVWNNGAADVVSGAMVLTLLDAATNTWVSAHNTTDGSVNRSGGGAKSLTATLTQLRLSNASAFDAGSFNILIE